MENIYDIILVGSGLSAVGCLLALENSGRKILLVDVGIRDNGKYKVPEGMDFLSLRYSDNEQYKYFTGEYLETMVWDKPMTGAQMTPPRKYVVERVEELQPVISNNFHPLESLSYGGLGNAWGLGCYVYSDGEIKKTGLDINDLKKAYSVITSLIGVAEPAGSAREYSFGDIRGTLPELKMDNSIEALYIRYNKKMDYFKKKGLYMGHPPLALLTEDINDRGHTLYNDMDFYSDNEKSAYRPWITIDKMISDGKIKYKGGIYVLSFKEENEYVSVLGYDIKKEENCLLYGRKLVLCTGALGTARLVIRSFNRQIKRLPVFTTIKNP